MTTTTKKRKKSKKVRKFETDFTTTTPVKVLTQEEKDARTSFWCINSDQADQLLAKIHKAKIKISCFTEDNMVITNRNFTKTEYKKVFPIVKASLL